MLRLGIGLMAGLALALSPAVALAQLVPPGSSSVNQYTETYPTLDGDTIANDAPRRPVAKVLGARGARRLEALGKEGEAAAALATATAPVPTAASPQRRAPAPPGSVAAFRGYPARETGGGEAPSGFGEVIRQATGPFPSTQTGLLVPLAIVATTVGSFVYLWRRKR